MSDLRRDYHRYLVRLAVQAAIGLTVGQMVMRASVAYGIFLMVVAVASYGTLALVARRALARAEQARENTEQAQ